MSLRRAAAVIQAAGLSGTPLTQCVSAAVNASCMASSARSNDPEILIRPAMIRPDSRRKMPSTVLRSSSIYALAYSEAFDSGAGFRISWMGRTSTHPLAPPARTGNPGRPLECFVKVFALQDVIPGELLLGFRKRPVGHHHLAVLHPDGGCRLRRLQWVGAV